MGFRDKMSSGEEREGYVRAGSEIVQRAGAERFKQLSDGYLKVWCQQEVSVRTEASTSMREATLGRMQDAIGRHAQSHTAGVVDIVIQAEQNMASLEEEKAARRLGRMRNLPPEEH